ncbi:PAS domain S-box-containing protein/diguanylate cyclase (GGDEF)-like protein [Motilibacter rhizosphaerae]|uniref:PAS domain S-box-containing protein/diguanylate cyclase (GGDEF)-like protein n=1 Tax=Motilibacter rhizosphaerae TaxID=598652 RepID=A0A4Q7NG45_9ACTN|nr:GGDEF domain-containing protein [Motilibacter rhizosphaerae]RZS82782.1 PAS domain S-box-containing protein/diguanylate cyclase (GGDEF)-like protein [Motilibacter rhizosphaerae]
MARGTIGVLAPLLGGFYYGGLLRGIATAAAAADLDVLAIQTLPAGRTHAEYAAPPEFDLGLAADHILGYVCVAQGIPLAQEQVLRRAGRPVVQISGDADPTACRVVPDNASGVREAVLHLLEHGHRRIGWLGNLVQPDLRARHQAYVDMLRENGIEPEEDWLLHAPDNLAPGGRAVAQRLVAEGRLGGHDDLTALLCGTDLNAFGLLDELALHGVEVPRDLAVVGFDDVADAGKRTPSLASVSLEFDALGQAAAELLLAQAEGRGAAGTRAVPTRLVPRESCGCASPGQLSESRPDPLAVPLAAPQAPQDVLEEVLLRLVGGLPGQRPLARRAALLAHTAISTAGQGRDGRTPELLDAFGELLLRSRDQECTGELVLAARAHATRLGLPGPAGGAQLDVLATALWRALARAGRQQAHRDFHQVRELLTSQYAVSGDLLQSGVVEPRSLSWLGRTPAQAGCFAVTTDRAREGLSVVGAAAAAPDLLVEGVYLADRGTPGQAPGTPAPRATFPPRDLLDRADTHEGVLVFVVPVPVPEGRTAYLAITGRIETQVTTGQESVNQWGALLSVALQHEQTLQRLRASEERYAVAAEAANDGLWDWDVEAGTMYVSSRWGALLGDEAAGEVVTPGHWLRRVHPDDRPRVDAAVSAALDVDCGVLEVEHRLRTGGDHWRRMLARALRVDDGRSGRVRLVGSLTDIEERKLLEDRLRRDALYDSLTGLGNRILFLDRLTAAVREQPTSALLFLDLDGFKPVNDRLGHAAGDRLLVEVAGRISAQLRSVDVAARLGGDEFAVLLTGGDGTPRAAQHVAARLIAAIAAPVDVDGTQVSVTASIGIVGSLTAYGERSAEDGADAAVRDADAAMYAAKASGKSRAVTAAAPTGAAPGRAAALSTGRAGAALQQGRSGAA